MAQAMQPDGGTLPSLSTIQAAVSLLADPLPRVVRVCSERILEWGTAASDALREAAEHPDPRLRVRARALLRALELREWIAGFETFARRLRRARAPSLTEFALLEEGALLLSAIGRCPARADAAAHLDRLGALAAGLVAGRAATSAARQLAELLAGREEFVGSRGARHEPRDACLDSVLERRCGMPASLALVYLLVGRRAGLRIARVEMPGHALLRLHGSRPVLIDPFHGGRTVTRADCLRYLRTIGHGHPSSCLRDLDDRGVLLDFAAELQQVSGYKDDRAVLRAIEQAGELLASE